MWLAKPVYELLPYGYFVAGAAAIVAAAFADAWYWAQIFTVVGAACLVAGLVVLLKRRGYRASRSRVDFEKTR
jgi:sugar phosphate permease